MTAYRKRAWTVAVAVSVIFHALVAVFLFKDWRISPSAFDERAVEISLERPKRPAESPRQAPKPPSPAPRQILARPGERSIPLVISPGLAPSATGAAPGPGAADSDREGIGTRTSGLRLPCIGRNLERMRPAEREACQKELMRTAGVIKPLPRGVDGPNLSRELQGEFKSAKEKRRQNDPIAKTGPQIEDMTVEIFKREF